MNQYNRCLAILRVTTPRLDGRIVRILQLVSSNYLKRGDKASAERTRFAGRSILTCPVPGKLPRQSIPPASLTLPAAARRCLCTPYREIRPACFDCGQFGGVFRTAAKRLFFVYGFLPFQYRRMASPLKPTPNNKTVAVSGTVVVPVGATFASPVACARPLRREFVKVGDRAVGGNTTPPVSGPSHLLSR
jgi:hypothetical protein